MGLPVPNHDITISDGGAGIIGTTPDGFFALVGSSSLGTNGGMYLFRGTDTKRVSDVLGVGPLAKAVVKQLIRSGGKDTLAYKSAAATPGASGSVTRTGTTGPAVTLSGTPYDAAQVILKVLAGGARGTATFIISFDGGDTWSDTLTTAATYLLESGVTVNFPATSVTMAGSPSDVDFANTGASTGTITRNTGSFSTDGFRVGMTLTITGSTSNNGATLVVTNVATSVLTVSGTVVNEANVNAPAITGTQLYVADETYAWDDTAPVLSSGNISTALDDIIDSEWDPEAVHVVGHAASASDSRTVATLLSSKVAAAWGVKKFFWACFDAPPVTDAVLSAAFTSFADKAVVGFAGFAEVSTEARGAVEKLSQGWVLAPRIARQPVEVHPMRTTTDENIDPLPDVVELLPETAVDGDGYHDEARIPGLNEARFCSLMSIHGATGFYVAAAQTLAAANSNYKNLPHLRIILKVARVYYRWGLSQLGRRVQKDPTTGYIRATIAEGIEGEAEKVIKDSLGAAIDGVRVLVNRADDLKNDPTLRSKVRVVVGEYILEMETDVGIAQTLPVAA